MRVERIENSYKEGDDELKDYKGIIEHKETKERKVVYAGSTTIASFKLILKGIHPDYKVISAQVNKESSVMYWCNTCDKEVKVSERAAHEGHN